jgi:hypothetical protein
MTDFRGKGGPTKPDYAVGDKIQIVLNGVVWDAVVKAVLDSTSGKRYAVSFDGGKRAASVGEWQIARE